MDDTLLRPPLDGVRALDLSRDIAGAYATRLLVWAGVEVLKVEPPGGDVLRYDGPSQLFDALNAGKRSIALDLTREEGAALLRALVLDFDLVVDDWPPGELDRLGIGYAAFAAAKPRLVHVSVTPFGLQGPLAGRDASDRELFEAAGLAAEGAGPYAARLRGGLHAFAAATTALYAALVTEVGHHVEVAAIEALAATLPTGARAGEVGASASPGLMMPFSLGPTVADAPPPALGEHTDEVLYEELALDGEEVARLRAGGIV